MEADFGGRTILLADEEGRSRVGHEFCCRDEVRVTGTEEVKELCNQTRIGCPHQYRDLPEYNTTTTAR